MEKPRPGEYDPFYSGYTGLTRDMNLLQSLHNSSNDLLEILQNLAPDKENYAYAPGKWTIKQLIRHVTDADIVFFYRAVSIARSGARDLPGFDENQWAQAADVTPIPLAGLLEDFQLLRSLIIRTFKYFTEDELEKWGNANNADVTVRSIGYIIAGHTFHHVQILKERYL